MSETAWRRVYGHRPAIDTDARAVACLEPSQRRRYSRHALPGGNRMSTHARILAVAALVLVWAPPTPAHHSNSAYRVDQIVELTGTVKEWRWMNPHTWLLMTVQGADGKTVEWA